jgi:hypothetical protein
VWIFGIFVAAMPLHMHAGEGRKMSAQGEWKEEGRQLNAQQAWGRKKKEERGRMTMTNDLQSVSSERCTGCTLVNKNI